MAFPLGMNRVPTGQKCAQIGNHFAIPSTSEIPQGSQERRGSVRARSRERGGGRRSDRSVSHTGRPGTPRQPAGPPPVQEEVDREDMEGRITALEKLQ